MANITIDFTNTINQSLQIGDIVYFQKNNNVAELGVCTSISSDRLSLVANIPDTNIRPEPGDYFMFGKNNVINSNGLIGYHATVKLTNDATSFKELFAVNSEINISSN